MEQEDPVTNPKWVFPPDGGHQALEIGAHLTFYMFGVAKDDSVHKHWKEKDLFTERRDWTKQGQHL